MEIDTMPRGFEMVKSEGRRKLIVPPKKRTLEFVYPSYGPGSYFDVEKAIKRDGCKTPSMAEIASLLNATSPCMDITSDKILWAFTGNLYVSNEGVYIQDNPQVANGKLLMDRKSLVEKLESGDKSVRFVPTGFRTGNHTPRQLEESSYIIALAGEEGAEKLAEVASRYRFGLYLHAFAYVREERVEVSALTMGYCSLKLNTEGSWDHFEEGHSFGVCAWEK